MHIGRAILIAGIVIGLSVWSSDSQSQRGGRVLEPAKGKTSRALEFKFHSRIRKHEEEQLKKEAVDLQNSLRLQAGEADGLVKLLHIAVSRREPLIAALGSSRENDELSAALGRTSALIYSRARGDNVLNSPDVSQKVIAILDAAIFAASNKEPSRAYMIDYLARLNDALRTGDSKRLESILGEFVVELEGAKRDIEEGGGNCCAEKTCECENRLR